jgi:DNA sulfur modification protein DndC
MKAMIVNDDANEWMYPLLRLRDALDVDDDRDLREFQRANGSLTLHRGRLVHGLYTQQARADWLRRLLTAQQRVRERAPEQLRGIELVSMAELKEIRRIWVFDKHEAEDLLPEIWQDVTGEPWPGPTTRELLVLPADSLEVLAEVCGEDQRLYEGMRTLLGIERSFRARGVRRGVLEELEKAVRRFSFATEEEALAFALAQGSGGADGDEQLSLFEGSLSGE